MVGFSIRLRLADLHLGILGVLGGLSLASLSLSLCLALFTHTHTLSLRQGRVPLLEQFPVEFPMMFLRCRFGGRESQHGFSRVSPGY